MDLDAGYLGALTAARSALGLDAVLPELAASREDRLVGFWGFAWCWVHGAVHAM